MLFLILLMYTHHQGTIRSALTFIQLLESMCRGVARGGGGGVHMSPGAKVQGRQNEAYKTIVDYVNYL